MDVRAFYDSPAWRALRDRRLAADGRRCTVGRLLGGDCSNRLHVHHLLPVGDRPDLALDFDNTATVCDSHHPTWEALARAVRAYLGEDLPPCGHQHRYVQGREECDRRRRAKLLARRAGQLRAA